MKLVKYKLGFKDVIPANSWMIEWLGVGSLNKSVAGGVSKNFEFNILSKGLYARKTRNYKCLHITLRYTNPDFKISLYVCVHIKTTSWNFAFYILRILKLFPVRFVNFLKIRLIFYIFYCFSMFANNFSHISRVHISKTKSVLMWNLRLIIFIRRQRY